MGESQLINTFIDQSEDLYWVVSSDFKLIGANKSYQGFMKKATGAEKKLRESAFIEAFGKADMKKWKALYTRALKGERFEVESHFYNKKTKETEYNQITFAPLEGDDRKIFAVACQSKDITRRVKHASEVNQLIDQSLDVFCTFNEEGEFVYASAAAEKHWGYKPEELIGKRYIDMTLEEDISKTEEAAIAIESGRDINTFHNRFRKKDGGIACNLWSSRWDDTSKLFYSVARDNKEQVEQEEKILLSEQRFRALVQEGHDLYAIIDREGTYTYMSPSSTAIVGLPPEAFIGKNAFEYLHPDDRERTLAALRKVITEGRVDVDPYRAKNQNNEWRWVESVLTNMLDNSAINGIVINSRDVTDKVEQEEKIVRTKKRFETLIENSTDCISIISPEGETVYISKAIKNILGYTPSEMMELDIRELIHPEDIEGVKLAISEAMKKPGVSLAGHTSKIEHKDGSRRWIKATVTNLIHDPSIGGIVEVISDVTEQKNEELEKDLISTIFSIFNQKADNDLTTILSAVSEQIVQFGDFSFAEMWLPTFDNKRVSCTVRYAGNKAGRRFYQASKNVTSIDIEEGLSDQVLKNRETAIWEPVDDEWNLLKRKAAAEKAGIKSLIAIPLMHNYKLLGCLLIGTEKTKSSLSVNRELFQKLESTLGSELSRKKTEIELSQIFNFTPDLICVAGFDGFFKRINPAGLALLGYSLNEIRSRPIKSFAHEEDQPKTERNQSKLYEGENLANFENRYITKEGKVIWLSWTAASLPEQGIIYAVAKDITEEKKLRELNRQVGVLAKTGSWEVDLKNERLFWSEMVHHLHETDPASFVPDSTNTLSFYRQDFYYTVSSQFENSMAAGTPIDFEAVLVTAKNNERWVRVVGNSEMVDGECKRIYGSLQDIHERKTAELAVKESEARFRTIFEIASLGIIQVDPSNGHILLANSYYETITGFSTEELLQISFLELTHPEDRESDWELFSKAARGETEYRNEKRYVKKDGTIVWVRIHLAFIRDNSGKPIRTVAICEDITERKEAEARLQNLSDNLPGVVFQYLLYPDGTDQLRYVSKGSQKIWGYSPEEVEKDINLVWDQTRAGGDYETVKQSIINSVENKTLWSVRYRTVSPDGEKRILQGLGTPEFLADGTVLYNSVISDITQETKNEELLEQIAKIARIGSWEMDLVNQNGDHMYWSPMLFEITEVDDDYTPTLSGGVAFHVGESKERLGRALNALITEGLEFDEEILLHTAKGRERWCRAIGKSETVNGKRIRIYGSYQDIHEQKVAELELKKSLKSLKDYKYSLDQSAIIAFTDKRGVITSANDNFCEISGYSRKELIGNTHQLINAGHHPAAFFSDLWKTITSGRVWRGEIKNERKEGSHYWVDTTIVPFLDERKRPTQYLAIRFDITERKIAEEERNSLQATIENSLNEIYTFNAETLVFDYANRGALLNLGYTLEELKAFTPIDIKPHYTLPSFKKLVAPLVNNEKEKIIFFTDHKRKNGSLYPVEVHLQLVAGGISERFLAVVLDITERKRAHQHLLQANERFEKVTEATHDAIWDWDIAEQRFYRSKAIERFFGEETSQLIAEDDFWKDAFHPKDLPILQKSLKEALADPSQDRWKQEYRIFNDQGETLHVIDRGVIIRNRKGKPVRMVGAMTDVTQQRKSEEENRFKANLLSMIGQAAIATSPDGVVNYWNDAAETIYGWKKEEALGMNIVDLTPLDTNREEANQIMELLKNGQTWTGEFEVKKKDGTRFPVRISNSPIYDENDSFSGIIGISSDITEEVKKEKLLKQYTHDLERSNEELEQFAFVASHDLQEPLRMISSFMELLERKYKDKLDEKALLYIHFATDGAKRMKQIILDLLDYSRASRPSAGKEKVDMDEILSKFKLLRNKLISDKSASIQSKGLPTLHTYKAAVTQVLHCLLDNALKYTEQGVAPEIEIEAREKSTEWVFYVKDNGIGIDAQYSEKIFVLFQRLHNNDQYEGTGIGLSVAKRHVEFLGGRIALDTSAEKGSTFYFSIPKSKDPEQ